VLDRLGEAVEDLDVVGPEEFTELAEGLCDLRDDHAVEPALIVVRAGSGGTRSAALAEVVLLATVHEVDVVGRLADGTLAVLLDADVVTAALVAHRIHAVLRRALVDEPVWVGVGSSASDATAALLHDAATGALDLARRRPGGALEVAGW
jgi:hypothetical protein